MTRKEFIRLSTILGIGLHGGVSMYSLGSNSKLNKSLKFQNPNDSDVLIIGAGAAGMSAAYRLHQEGVNYRIIEACDCIGGRMKVDQSFADFPVNFGSEWFSDYGSSDNELELIVNDPNVEVNVELFDDFAEGEDDRKFFKYSWFNFFEDYIYPTIKNNITYYQAVNAINYSGDRVSVSTTNGAIYSANKLIVTVPISVLKNRDIVFTPELPQQKQNSIDNIDYWGGFRAYFKFSNKFFDDYYNEIVPQQKIFYDATFGQESSDNILGFFVVGEYVDKYNKLDGDELKNEILREIEEIPAFNNKAIASFMDYVYYKWDENPYARGAYVSGNEGANAFRDLEDNVANKIFFAGDSYTNGDNWGYVHVAAQRARAVVEDIIS